MAEGLRNDAEQAIGLVVEGICPLCKVNLLVHDGRACCKCCGDSYKAADNRLEIAKCAQHGRRCEHWEAVWSARRSN